MHYTKPRTPALVAQKELVELRPRKLPPVHRVEPLPALVVGILVLGVAEQALLQLLQEELHRFAVHSLLRQGVVADVLKIAGVESCLLRRCLQWRSRCRCRSSWTAPLEGRSSASCGGAVPRESFTMCHYLCYYFYCVKIRVYSF